MNIESHESALRFVEKNSLSLSRSLIPINGIGGEFYSLCVTIQNGPYMGVKSIGALSPCDLQRNPPGAWRDDLVETLFKTLELSAAQKYAAIHGDSLV